MTTEQMNLDAEAGLSPATRACYDRLADCLAGKAGQGRCPLIGINGSQGSGKSTLAKYLVHRLAQVQGLRAAVLSIDDCYLSHVERAQLAEAIHPLLSTRGVPGTHDVDRGMSLLRQLQALGPGDKLKMPSFSKAEDDLRPEENWPQLTGPFDLILFEGWCVGIPPEAESALLQPANRLEAEEDPRGTWRRYVNDQLAGPYATWFSMLDALVYIQIPGFEYVKHWRGQQEQETKARSGSSGRGLMDTAGLDRFIQHYERLTCHAMDILPTQADYLLAVDDSHEVTGLVSRD